MPGYAGQAKLLNTNSLPLYYLPVNKDCPIRDWRLMIAVFGSSFEAA